MNDFKIICPVCGCNIYFEPEVDSIEYIEW